MRSRPSPSRGGEQVGLAVKTCAPFECRWAMIRRLLRLAGLLVAGLVLLALSTIRFGDTALYPPKAGNAVTIHLVSNGYHTGSRPAARAGGRGRGPGGVVGARRRRAAIRPLRLDRGGLGRGRLLSRGADRGLAELAPRLACPVPSRQRVGDACRRDRGRSAWAVSRGRHPAHRAVFGGVCASPCRHRPLLRARPGRAA